MVKALSADVNARVRRRLRARASSALTLVAFKTIADLASKAVTLVVTIAAARSLNPADFGVMALGMTTGWLLGVASDAGLPMFAATRVATLHAAGHGTYPIVHEVMRWRARLAAVAATTGLLVAPLMVPAAAIVPFSLIVLHQLLGAMFDTIAHVYRGLARTDIESTLSLWHRATIALAALTVLAVTPTLVALSAALAVPSLVALVASQAVVRRIAQPGPSFTLDYRAFAHHVAPLGLGVLISALYFRIDVYFLERLHGIEVVGRYNAAFRLVDAVRLLAAAALAVAYPTLCSAATLAPLRRVATVLVGTSVLVTAVVFWLSSPLLTFLYGDAFASAGPALRVLSLSIPFFFLNYALTYQLIAWERTRAYLGVAVMALLTNVALNAWLIPAQQMIGAAYATLVTEAVVCSGCLAALRRR
jgi:O-antigen/teichoic acid export membrane protein